MRKRVLRLYQGGIRSRIFLLVTLLVLPFAVVLGLIYEQRYQARRDNALAGEKEVAQGLAETFSTYVNGLVRQSLSIGHAIRDFPSAGPADITRLLEDLKGHSPGIRNLSWLAPDGTVISSSAPGFAGRSLASRDYLQRVMAGEDWALGDLMERGSITGLPTIALVTAIRHPGGATAGMVVAGIEPDRLEEVVFKQPRAGAGAVALFDSKGALVYHNQLKGLSWQSRQHWVNDDPILRRVLQTGIAETGTWSFRLRGGAPWIAARVPIQGLGWVAGAGIPADVAYGPVRQGMVQDLLLGLFVFSLAFLLAWLLGRNISGPLLRLATNVEIMGTGKVVEFQDLTAPREVRHLHATVARMASEIIGRAEALRESEGVLRTIFDSVYDGIIIHTETGEILDVNQRFLEMYRMRREDALGITIAEISAPESSMAEAGEIWAAVIAGRNSFFQWRARRSDNSVFDVEVFLCRVRISSHDRIMANVRDITERRMIQLELQQAKDELEMRVHERTVELEKSFQDLKKETEEHLAAVEDLRRKEQLLIQQSRLAAMGEMITNIAHQWRQPLNIIGLIIQELLFTCRQGGVDEQHLETSISQAMDVLQGMSKTIDSFGDFLSPDRQEAPFSVREVVEKALVLMEADLSQLHVRVTTDFGGGCAVYGFRNSFIQVLLAILANARDAFRERKVEKPEISIRCRCAGPVAVLTIGDNGGGIGPDLIDRVFDPYFTTKGPDKGTGIGLFMSRTIIEKSMNGRLGVRNTDGGAEFRIEVKLAGSGAEGSDG